MNVTARIRLYSHIQNGLFVLLLITVMALLAWLTSRYQLNIDSTLTQRYSLSAASIQLLEQLSDPIHITAYASNNSEARQPIKEFIKRYQKHKSDIQLKFINPDYAPEAARQHNIQLFNELDSELIIEYQGRQEHLKQLTEVKLTPILQQLARSRHHQIVFLEGHGERNLKDYDQQGLSQLAEQLKTRGFQVHSLNFAKTNTIADKTQVLVLADPQKSLLPGEITAIHNYVNQGGHLLWLIDGHEFQGLEELAAQWGLNVQPGLIVDPISQLLGVNDPSVVSITTEGYGRHPITSGLKNYITLFPQAHGLTVTPPEGWQSQSILKTNAQSWSETGTIKDRVTYEQENDISGPLDIGIALTQELSTHDDEVSTNQQRVVIIGDSDFLTNTFLRYGNNLDLVIKIMNWLSIEDNLIDIPTQVAADIQLQLSPDQMNLLLSLFLFMLPVIFISMGIMIGLQRRKT